LPRKDNIYIERHGSWAEVKFEHLQGRALAFPCNDRRLLERVAAAGSVPVNLVRVTPKCPSGHAGGPPSIAATRNHHPQIRKTKKNVRCSPAKWVRHCFSRTASRPWAPPDRNEEVHFETQGITLEQAWHAGRTESIRAPCARSVIFEFERKRRFRGLTRPHRHGYAEAWCPRVVDP